MSERYYFAVTYGLSWLLLGAVVLGFDWLRKRRRRQRRR